MDGRFALGPAAQLFTSGVPGLARAGFVNSIQFVNGWMPPAAIAALGGPTADGLPPGNGVLKIKGLGRNASTLELLWSGPETEAQLQQTTNLITPDWQDVLAPTTNRQIDVPLTADQAYFA